MVMTRCLALGAALALLASCPGYSPTFEDCRVRCSSKGTCPAGRECKQGFCRPPMATTSCECTTGAQRPCGGGMGLCTAGVQTCTNSGNWGMCVGEGKPAVEICDGKDNDCNGSTDDSVSDAPPCPLSKGICTGFTQQCIGGVFPGTCDVAEYGANYEVIETRCDNFDNDCDGVTDATRPGQLMMGVSDFVLAPYDGGFSIIAVEDNGAGQHQVVVLRLNKNLQPRGLPVPVSPPGLADMQHIAGRVTGSGNTFVAWADASPDSGVQLSAVDTNGIVSQFPPYPASQKSGGLSVGVSASRVSVAWPAQGARFARMVSWELGDGGVATKDYWLLPDGGLNDTNQIHAARLSPTAKVIGFNGTDNDAGTSYSAVVELPPGMRINTGTLGGAFQFTEVGALVQAGWRYSKLTITFIPPFFGDESGFEFKNDVFAAPIGSLKKTDNLDVTAGSIGQGLNSSVVVWTEKNQTALIGSPFGNGAQARVRLLVGDGGYYGLPQVAHPGGTAAFIGFVWRDTISGTGNLQGMMICQP